MVRIYIGTTSLTDDDHRLIDQAARTIAVLQAPNMSLGVNLLFSLAGQTAQRLGDDYDLAGLNSIEAVGRGGDRDSSGLLGSFESNDDSKAGDYASLAMAIIKNRI